MKNTKRLFSIFDEALAEAARDFAKEMGHKTIYKNDATTYAKHGNIFSKIIAVIKSGKKQSVRQPKFG
jgi:hypothetical protein